MKKTVQIITGLLLLTIQLVISYIDRFILAFLPWMEVQPITTELRPLKQMTNSLIRVGVAGLIYLVL